MGFFGFGKKNKEKEQEKMKTGLEKTRTGFWGNILNTLTGSVIDDDMYDDLEEQLILADVGGEVAVRLVDKLRDRVHEKGLKTGEEAADALRDIIAEEMTPDAEMDLSGKPAVILVIGVNGVGKTTSIAKLADHYTREGKKVMLAAGDTFRAAASEQLEIWADRAGVPIVSAGEGADPAAVIFDTVKSATARGYDMVIADTAGRLHNKANLMAELSKISRSVKKASPEASLETLLVLDAITGQNAISQAKEFCKAADATGIILTKLDGTAKGGCVVAVKQRLGLPVRFIGVGEGIDDLLPFTPEGFVEELLRASGSTDPLTVPSASCGAGTELPPDGELGKKEKPMKICAATGNAGKLRELRRILEAQGHEVVSQKELGITIEPEETGTTFAENALIKAETICKACGLPTIADDSGLCVDALNGAPGVYSARYCGRHGDDEANNDKLLDAMQAVPAGQRGAKFVSAVCFILPDGRHLTCMGECPGSIAFERLCGDYGFGYDPLFIPADCGVGKHDKRPNTEERSYAQLMPDEKDAISHRGNALAELEKELPDFLK